MRVADIRELFAYNAWANARLLAAAAALTAAEFAAPTRFPRRSLRGYLVHVQNAVRFHLGQWEGDFPDLDRPRTITFAGDGVRVTAPPWKHTAHIVNHGTQHRSDAAQLLTELGHSPGDLDLLDSQPMTPIAGWGHRTLPASMWSFEALRFMLDESSCYANHVCAVFRC